jgi:hypothetical protein
MHVVTDGAVTRPDPQLGGMKATLPADFPLAGWTPFEPRWSGHLGDGVLAGQMTRRRGSGVDRLHFEVTLIWGTTTSHGDRVQQFWLPQATRCLANTSFVSAAAMPVGNGILETIVGFADIVQDRKTVLPGWQWHPHEPLVYWSDEHPFKWTAGCRALISGSYEVGA